jgi:hypothetical protein
MLSFPHALRALQPPRLTRSPLFWCAIVAALALLSFFVHTVVDGVERGTALRQVQREQEMARVERASARTPNRRVQAAAEEAAAGR